MPEDVGGSNGPGVKIGLGMLGLGIGHIVFDVVTIPSGEGLFGLAILTGAASQ